MSEELDLDAINAKLEELTKKRDTLLESLRTEAVELAPSTEQKFEMWLKLGGPKKDYPYVEHIVSSSGKELLMYDTAPLYPERRETITIERIADCLTELLEEAREEGGEAWGGIVEQDVFDWMESLIELELKSIRYDW
jgi:hypothetical protein